jgi:hypothetical protein
MQSKLGAFLQRKNAAQASKIINASNSQTEDVLHPSPVHGKPDELQKDPIPIMIPQTSDDSGLHASFLVLKRTRTNSHDAEEEKKQEIHMKNLEKSTNNVLYACIPDKKEGMPRETDEKESNATKKNLHQSCNSVPHTYHEQLQQDLNRLDPNSSDQDQIRSKTLRSFLESLRAQGKLEISVTLAHKYLTSYDFLDMNHEGNFFCDWCSKKGFTNVLAKGKKKPTSHDIDDHIGTQNHQSSVTALKTVQLNPFSQKTRNTLSSRTRSFVMYILLLWRT